MQLEAQKINLLQSARDGNLEEFKAIIQRE